MARRHWLSFLLLIVVVDARLEHALADPADRAYPIVGKVFKRRAGSDSVFGIAFLRIVCVAARITEILFHRKNSFLIMYLGLRPLEL